MDTYCTPLGLDLNLVAAVMMEESYIFDIGLCPAGPNTGSCTSYAGAIGMMQVMPFHATYGEDLRDPDTNIRKGCEILRQYLDKMGTTEGGLAAYNAGPGGAANGGGWGYASQVMSFYNQYR